MKNRAKCRLCLSVIESFHPTDYVLCKCGEIAVDGGESMYCCAKNWNNFMRVDDEGNEIVIKIKDNSIKTLNDPDDKSTADKESTNQERNDEKIHKITKKEMLNMLSGMIDNIENLPDYAKSSYINHYDFSSLLILLLALFKEDCS